MTEMIAYLFLINLIQYCLLFLGLCVLPAPNFGMRGSYPRGPVEDEAQECEPSVRGC